ncbi:MAG: ferredoxin family protein [Eubacterium sp.]|nr:ferredoxin family protein [Eubacterium sp.]
MSIRIDKKQCIGCGRCLEACPGNLIDLDADRKAYIRIAEDCWGCTSCLKECPVSAISLYLGADIGGAGSTMKIERNGDIYNWKIRFSDGTGKTISVNRKNANKY